MRKIAAGAMLALSLSGTAHAADATQPWHFLIGGGLTLGGEKLITVTFSNGDSEDIRSGGLLALRTGVEYRFDERFSVQATVGYHIHDTSAATNGSVRFSRYPFELLAHYQVNNQWRLGGGLRRVDNVKLKGTGDASIVDVKFDNTQGFVLEGEYFPAKFLGLAIRGVSERYKVSNTGATASGNHLGAFVNFYF